MPSRDVFISHSSGDAETARALRSLLEGAGYTCWMAPDDIVGTETWTEQILAAIADSKAMIVLISTAANKSSHVSREVNLALGKGRAVLPIRIEAVAPGGSLEYLLSLVQRVDAFPPPITDHGERVLHRLETVVKAEGDRPAMPAAASAIPVAPTTAATPIASTASPTTAPAIQMSPAVAGATAAPQPPSRSTGGLNQRTMMLIGGAIAAVAVIVIGAALLFKGPAASPGPSQVAVATQGPVVTAGPSAGQPTPTPDVTSGSGTHLSDVEKAAVALVPVYDPGIGPCSSWPTPPGAADVLSPSGYATSLARITCPGPKAGGAAVHYASYASKDAVEAEYTAITTAQGVARGGACATAIPANNVWNYPGYPVAGNVACYASQGGVQYVWTDDELRLLAQWLAPDNATGLAFWQHWEQARTPAEAALLANLPQLVIQYGGCQRAADDYYPTALAIVTCPRATGQNALFFAAFPPATDTFPNDPMTALFTSILTEGGVPADTTTGCYESSYGRYPWAYKENGSVGPNQGYVGCYQRTDTTPATAQIVWTYNTTGVMGLWNAPDVDTATKLFDSWITAVKP